MIRNIKGISNINEKMLKHNRIVSCRVKMMNVSECDSEESGCYKQINSTTVFYYLPHDAETSLRKGKNAIHVLDELGKRHISYLRDSNDKTY